MDKLTRLPMRQCRQYQQQHHALLSSLRRRRHGRLSGAVLALRGKACAAQPSGTVIAPQRMIMSAPRPVLQSAVMAASRHSTVHADSQTCCERRDGSYAVVRCVRVCHET